MKRDIRTTSKFDDTSPKTTKRMANGASDLALKWVARRLSGNFSSAESYAYEKWLSEEPEHAWEVEIIERILQNVDRLR